MNHQGGDTERCCTVCNVVLYCTAIYRESIVFAYIALNIRWGIDDSPAPTPRRRHWNIEIFPESKVHGAYMGPTWVLSAPDGPHVGPMNLASRVPSSPFLILIFIMLWRHVVPGRPRRMKDVIMFPWAQSQHKDRYYFLSALNYRASPGHKLRVQSHHVVAYTNDNGPSTQRTGWHRILMRRFMFVFCVVIFWAKYS